ncbi:MAG: T9SS type A sorting domain-containing protein [Bacteroidetes bacterium]|nr:T9SS type A sorting domain-containing protein [Bacteroidota bacterium]
MKKTIFLLLLSIRLMIQSGSAQVDLTLLSKDSLTPNATDTIGAFSRIFYHETRDKFYLVYAARLYDQPTPAGVLTNFTWLELDNALNETGNVGVLPGQTGAGDFAMLMVDTNYFHLTVGGTGDYLLSKYDDNFDLIDQVTIPLDACESNIDQLMNYTNGKLIIGAMYDSGVCPPINPPSLSLMPYTDIYQYDLDLTEVAAPVLLNTPSKITWGSSMIYNAGYYYEVTMNNFNDRDLYAFKYDAGFNYVSSTLLDPDGQWSQGVLFDGTYYYVAFHTGDHNHGNVRIKIFDTSWSLISTTVVTNYTVPVTAGVHSYNANRPFLLKRADKLYISYDVESYDYPANNKDWQAHLDVYQINGLVNTPVNELAPVSFYPNPAQDQVTVQTTGSVFLIELISMDGQLIHAQQNDNTLKTAQLSAGCYIIRLTENNQVSTAIFNVD